MRSRPCQTVIQSASADPASSLPGIAGASAAKITPGRKWPITWREATGAGCSQLRIEPEGAETCTGRNAPALCGTSGAIAAFIAYEA